MSSFDERGPPDGDADFFEPAPQLPATRAAEPEMFAGVGQQGFGEWVIDQGLNVIDTAGTLVRSLPGFGAGWSFPGLDAIKIINDGRKLGQAVGDLATGNLSGEGIVNGAKSAGKLGANLLTGKLLPPAAPFVGWSLDAMDELMSPHLREHVAPRLDPAAQLWNRTHERVFGTPGPQGLFGGLSPEDRAKLDNPGPWNDPLTVVEHGGYDVGELPPELPPLVVGDGSPSPSPVGDPLDVRGAPDFDVGPVMPELGDTPAGGIDSLLPPSVEVGAPGALPIGDPLDVGGAPDFDVGPLMPELGDMPADGIDALLPPAAPPPLTAPVADTPSVAGEGPAALPGPVAGEIPELPGPLPADLDGPHLGTAGVAGGAVGGTLALGSDLFRKFVLGEDIDSSQIVKDTAFGAIEGGVSEAGEELVSHGITRAATPVLGAGGRIAGAVLGGGVVDGAIAGITSTLSNAGAVESGEISAAQGTANVMVDTGVGVAAGLTGAATGMAAGAAVGSIVPVAGTAVGGAIGAGAGFVGGALGSIGLTMLAEQSGFSDWAKEGIADNIGFLEDPLSVTWSGINGAIDGAQTGAMIGGAGGAAMGAIGTGLSGAALGLMAGGPLGAIAGGLGGAALGAGGGALIGGGLGVIPGAGIGMGMGVVDGLADWLLPSAEQEGDFTAAAA